MVAVVTYRAARKSLRGAIRASKQNKWRALCDEINEDPWGLGYKIVMKRLRMPVAGNQMNAETMENIINTLFPGHTERNMERPVEGVAEVPLFTLEELNRATVAMKNKRAPGPDGIPSEIKMVVGIRPHMMLNMFNACIRGGF